MEFLKRPAKSKYDSRIDNLWSGTTECFLECYSVKLKHHEVEDPGRFRDENYEKEIIHEALRKLYEKCKEDYNVLGEDVKEWNKESRLNLITNLMREASRLPLHDQNIPVVDCIFYYMQRKASLLPACFDDPRSFNKSVNDIIASSYLEEIVSLLQEQDRKEEGPKKRKEEQEQEREKKERYKQWGEEMMRRRYG